MKISEIILAITAILTALVAGLFFAWTVSITQGLLRVSDSEYVSAMQATNRAIQNPVFFAVFFGAQILLLVCLFLFYGQGARFWLLLGAFALYAIGVMGVTIFGNVPLNNQLDRFEMQTAKPAEISAARKNYETVWNNLNTIRTVSSTLAVTLVIIACLQSKNDN